MALRYVQDRADGHGRGRTIAVPRLAGASAQEDLLFAANGVAWHGVATLADGSRIVATGGGWWVDRRGRRTTQRRNGRWTRGAPVWRDGGYRNRTGQPTFRLRRGGWSNGRGIHHLPYHDRFRFARDGERLAWQTAGAPARIAPLGARLRVDALPSTGCFVIDRVLPRWPAVIEVVIPAGADARSLPTEGDVTLLGADADPAACAN